MKETAKQSKRTTAQLSGLLASVLIMVALLTEHGQIAASAELINIKLGILRSVQNGAVFIADAKGYFAAEGLATKLVFFDGAQGTLPQWRRMLSILVPLGRLSACTH
jgi:ABC-type nitrate/sulfonate/bicarbonate transport system substrate-binding protein